MNIQTNQNWNLQFCSLSWTCTNESPTSGLTMLVVDIPSGYIMLQVFYYDDDLYIIGAVTKNDHFAQLTQIQ